MSWHIAVPAFGLACGIGAIVLAATDRPRRINWIGIAASVVNGFALAFWVLQ